MPDSELYIGGDWLPAASGERFDVLDPATGRLIGTAAEAAQADVDAAVAAAGQATTSAAWRDISPAARARILWRIGDLIDAHADELAELETLDQGQPLAISRGVNIPNAAEHFRYYAGWCTKIEGVTTPVSVPNALHYTRREPIGVCALIIPWNFPFMTASWKLAPALACGNTVIIKPAEQTPLSTVRLVELMAEAGVPAGVVNLLTGGPAVGRALTEHPDVDKVSFTGSTEVGRSIVRAAAGNFKRLTLELGGKAPVIVAKDADIDRAVALSIGGGLLNSGQVCAAFSRFYVDASRAAEFTDKLATASAALRIGPGLAPGTELGPLTSAEHLARVEAHVATARREGATVVSGGERPGGDLADGYFYRPTVVAGIDDGMSLARDEVFGPVLPILTYDGVDHLAERANAGDYGLSAAIFTDDLRTAHRLAAVIRAGTVHVNMLPVTDPAAPWGGFKSSGWGREMGPAAIEEYTEVKGVWIDLA